jgi:tetratricopeptide (TPR) repeat protein
LLYERHQFDEAEALVSRALDIDSRRLGHDHAELVTHLNLLGLIAKETGRYSDAELHLKRALSIDESAGLGHPWATTHVSNLACVMEELERFVEAEGFYRRAVNLTEAHLGPYDLALVVPLRDHARVLRILGRVPEAHEQEERAKEIEEAGLDAKVNLALSY